LTTKPWRNETLQAGNDLNNTFQCLYLLAGRHQRNFFINGRLITSRLIFHDMERPAFDDIYMELAVNLARRSHCIKRHVGVVLAKETRIISIGYNGPPSGTHNCDEEWPEVGCPRDSKGGCSLAIHAEQNAILYAVKNNISVEGSTLYTTLSPCLACARIIFSMRIRRVIYLNSYAEHKGIASDEGVDFLRKFGVTVDRYTGQLSNVTHMI